MRIEDAIVPGAFAALFMLVLVWFVLIRALFKRLETRHAEKYEEMGRPTLFRRNNLRTNYTTIKFLFGREHRELDDPVLSRLSDSMLVFTVLYLAAFVGLLAYTGVPKQAPLFAP